MGCISAHNPSPNLLEIIKKDTVMHIHPQALFPGCLEWIDTLVSGSDSWTCLCLPSPLLETQFVAPWPPIFYHPTSAQARVRNERSLLVSVTTSAPERQRKNWTFLRYGPCCHLLLEVHSPQPARVHWVFWMCFPGTFLVRHSFLQRLTSIRRIRFLSTVM